MTQDFEQLRKEYLSFIEDEQIFIPQFFPNYQELLRHIDIINSELENKKLQQEQFKPAEQLTLEPYERDHAVVVGSYRPPTK